MAMMVGAVGSFSRPGRGFLHIPAAGVGLRYRLAVPGGTLLRRLAVIAAIGVAIATLSAPRTEATPLERSVRNIAENILGPGTITFVQATYNDRVALLRWEGATYKPGSALAESRELLYSEAEPTSAVGARLPQFIRIHFVITRGSDVLARGEYGRSGLSLVFGSVLGGGRYIPTPTEKDKSGGSSRPTQVR